MFNDNSRQTHYNLGSTIRSCSVDETIDFIKPKLKKFGITRVADVTGLDCLGVPVAVSIRPNSKHLSVSQGKGLTWKLAMVSAIMESIEGYHAENPAEPEIYGSYNKLAERYPVINPEKFVAGFFTVADLLNWEMDWIEARDIMNNKTIYIPHALICLNSTIPHAEYSLFSVSSNGLAAGNSLEEAVSHAIYEIIERDALCRWSALSVSNRAATQIKLDTIDSREAQVLLKQFQEADQLVKVWDITSNLGVPTFHCVINDTNPMRGLGMFRGTGTHLNKQVSLVRTLAEVAQSRLTLISGSRDDVFLDHYQQQQNFSYSEPDDLGYKDYKEVIEPSFGNSFTENINYLLQLLLLHGFKEVFLVNHTKSEFDIPVVHVFIPGMQFNGTRI